METQELYCHACNRYVQFCLFIELDGEHVITCPNCGHEHYRYIDKGKISDRRWGSNNTVRMTYNAHVMSNTANSTSSTYTWTFSSFGNTG